MSKPPWHPVALGNEQTKTKQSSHGIMMDEMETLASTLLIQKVLACDDTSVAPHHDMELVEQHPKTTFG